MDDLEEAAPNIKAGKVLKVENDYYFCCPHCGFPVVVAEEDVRCTIFRHAVFKATMEPIPPHSSKQECDALVEEGKVHGCGKPFKFDGTTVVACGYI